MRVNPLRSSERGATIVITAISLAALLAVGALAVDLGNAWQTRRQVITASDAAALAAAQTYVSGGTGCGAVAPDYVARNAPAATMVSCTATTGGTGSVTVEVEQRASYILAPVFGIMSHAVSSSTTVRWGSPVSVSGLRPFGLCMEGSNEVGDWYLDPTTDLDVTIPYGKDDNADACNFGDDVPGNWGMVDFDGGANSNTDTRDWVANGYDGPVTAGPLTGDCTVSTDACYEGDTGAFSSSIQSELQDLVDSGETFTIPLFNRADGTGSNALLHLVGFAKVTLLEFDTSAKQADRYLRLLFQPGLVSGRCCGDASGVDTGLKVVGICAVDPYDTSGC